MLQLNEFKKEYGELKKNKSLREGSFVQSRFKWLKAKNDLNLAEGLLKISTDKELKDKLGYVENITFFDWVIVSSYYSIFHAAQSLLGLKKIKIIKRMHYATLVSFAKHFIINKDLEDELFFIYEDSKIKAKNLLEIFSEEKIKRGNFQYHRLSRNNIVPAKESINNARIFLEAVQEVLRNKNII